MPVPGGVPRHGPESASSARVHNYLAGGGNWGEADEAAARELLGICPQARRIARVNRLFASRAAGYAASVGVTQVIDLGSGVPLTPREAAHEAARSVRPGIRAAYVDLDRLVLGELDAIFGGDPDVALVGRDLRDPEAVLSDPGLCKVIDAGRPVLVLAALVLHFQPAREAAGIIGGYVSRVAAGSLVAVSVPRLGDPAVLEAIRAAYAPERPHDFTPAEVGGLFGGLDMVPPGIRPAAGLQPGWKDARRVPPGGAYLVAGIGRKPGPR
jgi:hypothetical protein